MGFAHTTAYASRPGRARTLITLVFCVGSALFYSHSCSQWPFDAVLSRFSPKKEKRADIAGVEETYYQIYDRAIALYYRPPRNPAKALRLLHYACENIKEEQALSCYNYGILRELEGRKDEALAAYRRAAKLRPHPTFIAARESLDENSSELRGEYLRRTKAMIQACRRRQSDKALGILREIAAAGARSDRPVRETFQQPFFRACLGKKKEYAALLKKLPAGPGGDALYKRYYREQARAHPFYSLWDMEKSLRFRNPRLKNEGKVSDAWSRVLIHAGKGDASKTALALTEFYDELNRLEKARAAPGERDKRRKILALRRSAALLIQQDNFFRKIRAHAEIRRLIAPWLR